MTTRLFHREAVAGTSFAMTLMEQLGNIGTEVARVARAKEWPLTTLYNQHPSWLANAHADLDDAVLAAYEWPEDTDDNELLACILALNLKRANGERPSSVEVLDGRATE